MRLCRLKADLCLHVVMLHLCQHEPPPESFSILSAPLKLHAEATLVLIGKDSSEDQCTPMAVTSLYLKKGFNYLHG